MASRIPDDSSDEDRQREERRVGLCATCVHAQIVPSSKGSTFYMCMLAAADPRFRRYPALPVLSCIGYRGIDRNAVLATEDPTG
jgi:hypothetical protein